MEFIIKLGNYLQSLSKKQIQQYFLAFFAGTLFVTLGSIYYIHSKSIDLLNEIKRLDVLANKSISILEDNQRMDSEEQRIQSLLDQNKDFNINSYFESFCQAQNLPSQGWGDSKTEEINDKFDEISLRATFKNQTTEKLVKILDELYKNDIIYIKNLSIKQESDKQSPEKKISFDITIATKAMKRGFEAQG